MTLVKVNNEFGRTMDVLMKDLFTEFPTAMSKTFREDFLKYPPVNISEKTSSFLIELSSPGFEKEDFLVKLDGNILNISTEKKVEQQQDGTKMIRNEFTYKPFRRSFTIDEKIDAENIVAKYENGILRLELPKKETVKAPTKAINIS